MSQISRSILPAILALALLALPGCASDTHEKAVGDMLDTWEEFVEVLKTVEDKADAEAAVPKVESISERLQEINDRLEALGEPSQEVDDALEARFNERSKALMTALLGELFRIAMLGDEVLDPIDAAMQSAMESLPGQPDESADEVPAETED